MYFLRSFSTNVSGLATLYRFRLPVFPHVFCAPIVIKRLIRFLLHGNNSMAKRRSDSPCASSAKKKYAAKYKPEWATDLQFICHSDKGPTFVYCRVCNTHINVAHGSPCKFGQSLYVAESHIIVHSNADSERVFSMYRKINTDSVNIAIMTVTYKLPRNPVLGTGIFGSIYKSGATRHQD